MFVIICIERNTSQFVDHNANLNQFSFIIQRCQHYWQQTVTNICKQRRLQSKQTTLKKASQGKENNLRGRGHKSR